jgi:type I restriction enzyme, S subunit
MASEWDTAPLSDLVDNILDRRGVTPLKLGSAFVASGYRVISAKAIKGKRVDLAADDPRFVDEGTYRKWMRTPLLADDVILTSEAPLGEPAYLAQDSEWCLGQRLFGIRTKKARLHGRFLFYALQSEQVRHDLMSRATGTTAQGIRQTELRRISVPLPTACEQRAIAYVLGTLDDKIELNRQMNETLEAMARLLFKSWFVDFNPVHSKLEGQGSDLLALIASDVPDCVVGSDLGGIPRGWKIGTLGDLGELALGGDWGEDQAFAGAVEANCLRGVDLEHFRLSGEAYPPRRWFKPSSLERRRMDERDVLIAGSGAGPTGRPLWMCAELLQTLGPCTYSNFCKRIRCGSAAQAVYLDAWLHEMRESGEIWEYVNGTSVPNLDAASLLARKMIPIPPISVLEEYLNFVRPIRQKLYAGQNRVLAILRDVLLPKLISGAVRIRDANRVIAEAF